METKNGIIGLIDRLFRRFGSWSTFERYWHADVFVAHDASKQPYIGDWRLLYQNRPKRASVTDPSTWRDPTSVFASILADKSGTLVGIGFVLHGDGTVCIDLDDVVDEHGNISPEAQRILDRFPHTYAEYSRSGRGIHIWLRTSKPLPEDGRRTNGIEIYQNKRYIAITMDILPDRPQDMRDYTDELHELYRELFGDDNNSPTTFDDGEPHRLGDDDLPEQSMASSGSDGGDYDQLIALFRQNPDNDTLWRGGQLPHHSSPSEADCALAYRLMWLTNGNAQLVYHLFMLSARVLRVKIHKRPELVRRAVDAAHVYYLQRRAQQQQFNRPVKPFNQNNAQRQPHFRKVFTRPSGSNKRATRDPFEDWFKERVRIIPSGFVPNDLAYQHYCDYVRVIGQTPHSMKRWAQLMAQKGVPIKQKMYKGIRTRCRLGITLVGVGDPFVNWFTKCVSIDAEGVVPNSVAYQSYCDYVRVIGQTPESMSKWARRMAEHRVPIKQRVYNGRVTRCRVGISLVQPSG
jgi:hypothetical protein